LREGHHDRVGRAIDSRQHRLQVGLAQTRQGNGRLGHVLQITVAGLE
jgi:hypothetical protein